MKIATAATATAAAAAAATSTPLAMMHFLRCKRGKAKAKARRSKLALMHEIDVGLVWSAKSPRNYFQSLPCLPPLLPPLQSSNCPVQDPLCLLRRSLFKSAKCNPNQPTNQPTNHTKAFLVSTHSSSLTHSSLARPGSMFYAQLNRFTTYQQRLTKWSHFFRISVISFFWTGPYISSEWFWIIGMN